MKRTTRTGLAALALAASLASMGATAWAGDVTMHDPRKLPVPAIGRIPAVKPERMTLPNGIVVYLLENHDLPVVKGTAYFRMSPSLVPADRAGLPGLVGDVMRSGGSAAHSGDWLDDRLAAIGANLSANVGLGQASSAFRCLSDNTAEVVGLWSEIVRTPAFPDEKIELAKVGIRRGIASRNDEMMSVLFRTASQAVYGKQNPWGMQAEYATVEPIAKDDCRALHGKVFVPERMIVAIYGDFRTADMKKLLTAKFADWAKSGTSAPVLPPMPTSVSPKLFFAPKEDVTQSGIVVAQVGSRADDPDYAALQVLEQGLGGGFSSRMFSHIRTQRGLAYAAGANAGTDFLKPGVFMAYTLTQSESTMTALGLVRDEVRAVTEAAFSNEELAVAKQAVVNGFVFNFEDPSQSLFRAAYYEAVGYPADFLQTYQKALEGVTADAVLAAARRKIQPAQQAVIVVGKEKDFDRPLESAGLPVERVDITIPPPPSKLGRVSESPASLAKGAEWLAAAAKLAGGSAAWKAVRTVVISTEASLSIQGQSLTISGEETWALPDRQVTLQKLPFGEMKRAFDGKSGWMSAMGQLQDDPGAGEEVAKDWDKSMWRLFGHAGEVQLIALDAPETVNGTAYRAAKLKDSKTPDMVVLFAADGHLAGFAYQDEGNRQMGPARVVELLSNWSAEGALQYPRTLQMYRDGKIFVDGKVTSLKLDAPVADDVFRKPAQ